MKILITGAEGFIGKHLTKFLKSLPYEVIGIDYKDGNLIEDGMADKIIAYHKPDMVIHLAAQVGIFFSEQDCEHAIKSNTLMVLKVAKACSKHNARLMYFSTSEVYGDFGNEMLTEDTPLIGTPTGIYAISKRWGEDAAKEYAPKELIIIRPSMPYGPGEAVGQGRRAMDNMLWQALHGLPIIVHKGSVRSWCWIGDVVEAIELIISKNQSGIFNAGRDDDERTMLEIAERSCQMTGANPIIIHEIAPPIKKTMVKRLSTKKLNDLGWFPKVDLDYGMQEVLDWVKNYDINGNKID